MDDRGGAKGGQNGKVGAGGEDQTSSQVDGAVGGVRGHEGGAIGGVGGGQDANQGLGKGGGREELTCELDGTDDDNSELLVVNGKQVNVAADLHVKSKLSQFCQKQKVPLPTYDVSVVNANNTPLQYFIATVKADGRAALGTGRNKKMAQTVAARAFLNNRFLPGNYNFQAGTPVCNPGVNPAKKRRQKEQMGKWVERQESRRSQESKGCQESKSCEDLKLQSKGQTGNAMVFFDLERSGGNIKSELIQIGYTDGEKSESWFIQPKGKISEQSSKYSHKMSLNKFGKLVSSTGVSLKCSSLFEAAESFVKFIKVKKDECGEDLSLVFYGGDDDICLLNNFAVVKMDQVLVENVTCFINFQDVIKDDDQFNKGSISLTKVQPNKMNISQQILGAKISEELKKSHDASYDADLLSRVCRVYMKSWSYAIDLKSYMIPSRESLQIAQLVVGRLIQKRIRRGASYEFLTFNGWK